MNCDQVFEILTRGPFPTGMPYDSAVETHLNGCPECRRLAEALRPALELFQEAIGPEESRDLPGYWCAVATDRTQPAVSYAKQVETNRPVPRLWTQVALTKKWSAVAAWRLAAVLALGVTLGSIVSSRATIEGLSAAPPARGIPGILVDASDDRPEPRFTSSQHQVLAALPAACFRHQPAGAQRYTTNARRVLANADLDNLDCCTDCHNSQSDSVPGNATAAVSQSCQFCHKD